MVLKLSNIVFFLICSINLITGQSKGVTTIPGTGNRETKQTYAIVVGISDYQHPLIPDLKYADKDATAFANFLVSPSAGNVDPQHIKLLLNSDATMAQFAVALDWLWEVCRTGDQAIIYFSGHGDVERKSISQPGFLLCYDSPANVYMSGGAFSLYMLQEIISTLSIKNQTQTIAILDACRSGKLAGSSIHGSQLTNANLARQYANEIKILSCQPDEYSVEGTQWGGGRGAFSFHLINGLYGLADEDQDQKINTYEINKFLGDKVRREVAPLRQVPMLIGSQDFLLSRTSQVMLDSINLQFSYNSGLISGIDPKGFEYLVGQYSDNQYNEICKQFLDRLQQKAFLTPQEDCAEYYYNILMSKAELKSLQSIFTRNYVAAMLDDIQQFINNILEANISFLSQNKKKRVKQSKILLKHMERCIQLLGTKHYLSEIILSRMEYFKAFGLLYQSNNPNKELGQSINDYLWNAISLQKDMPLYYYSMGMNHSLHLGNFDSTLIYFNKAIELAPEWMLPKIILPTYLYTVYDSFSLADQYFKKAMDQFPLSSPVLNAYGIYYLDQNKLTEAEYYLLKAHELDTNYIDPFINLANLYSKHRNYQNAKWWAERAIQMDSTNCEGIINFAIVHFRLKNYDIAEQYFLKAQHLDSHYISSYIWLGNLYIQNKNLKEAEKILLAGEKLDPQNYYIQLNLGNCYYFRNDLNKAVIHWKKGVEQPLNDYRASYNVACVLSVQNHTDEAYYYIEKAIIKGVSYNEITSEADYNNLKTHQDRWNELINKYFDENGNRKQVK